MKKFFKALLAVVLCIVMLIGIMPMGVFAEDENGKNVLVTITTDKASYSATDTAKVTVKVENKSGQKLTGVVISAKADNWLLAKGSASNVLDVGELAKGESKELKFNAVVNRKAGGVGIFDRIILFFKQLFNKPTEFASYSANDKSSTVVSKTVSHGGATVTITASCWYAPVKDDPEVPVVPITNAEDIDSYSDALADLVKNQAGENFDEEKAIEDEYYSARILVKTSDLDLTGYTPTAVIEGPDDICVVQFNNRADAKKFCEAQAKASDTEFAEPDTYQKFIESYNSWGVEYIEADEKAEYLVNNEYGRTVTVAVVDTGVDKTHPFLSGRILNGGYDYVDNDKTPYEGTEGTGHGTHCSGTIVDCTPDLNVMILPVRVLSSSGSGYNSWVASGIRYAAKNANVISMSLGGGKSSVVDDAVNYAISQGVTCCVAAGNENSDTKYCSPANVTTPGCICVSAIDSSGKKASFSNYGSAVDVCAPGVSVKSCVPGGGYATWNGTSMATPHISACAAMYLIEHNGATPAQIEKYITGKILDLGEKGYDKYYGYGVPKLMTGKAVDDSVYTGELIEFGSYPQTDVTSSMGTTLDSKATGWKSYKYYSGTGSTSDGKMTSSDYMQYCDVKYGGNKYRGVKFSTYRPYYTGYTASSNVQNTNGYETGTTYWFKYEPLTWRVLDSSTGLVLCENIIDSQAYNNYIWHGVGSKSTSNMYYGDEAHTYYANDYYNSSIRKWLNEDFYATAFSETEQGKMLKYDCDNSCYSSSYPQYDSQNSSDKVFLLSYDEVKDSTYGFSSSASDDDTARRKQGTDYAKCQGLFICNDESEYDGNTCWWLRSPDDVSYGACGVYVDGFSCGPGYYFVGFTNHGVCPALKLNLKSLSTQ